MRVKPKIKALENCESQDTDAAPAIFLAMPANGQLSVIMFLLQMHSDPVPALPAPAPEPRSRKTACHPFGTNTRVSRLPASL
jgi:hypothetical protein